MIKILYRGDEYPLSSSFLLGSLLCWTDTVAIGSILQVSLMARRWSLQANLLAVGGGLQEIGAPKRLNSLIKGESLANDITCVVLYKIVKVSACLIL